MINISKLAEEGEHWTDPGRQASLLGQAATDYHKAAVIVRAYSRQAPAWPLFFFQLPTTHQALELVTKVLVHSAVADFDPQLLGHPEYFLS